MFGSPSSGMTISLLCLSLSTLVMKPGAVEQDTRQSEDLQVDDAWHLRPGQLSSIGARATELMMAGCNGLGGTDLMSSHPMNC